MRRHTGLLGLIGLCSGLSTSLLLQACNTSDPSSGSNAGASAVSGAETGGTPLAGGGKGGAVTGGFGGTAAGGGMASGGSTAQGAAGSGGQPGAGGGGGPASLVLPIERAGRYVLEFESTLFEVSTVGGQVITFSVDGKNVLWPSGSAIAACPSCFGSTLWTSPQSAWGFPPPPVIDSGAYTASVSGSTITMVSGVSTGPGPTVRFTKKFTPDLAARAIDIEYAIKNEGPAPVNLAPWEVTRFAAGGLTFFPALGAPYPYGMLTPTASSSGIVWIDLATNPPGNNKVFADGDKSYLAHTDGTYLFVKSWADVPSAAHAANEGEVEYYDGDSYVELENQGSYGPLAAGESTSYRVRWALRPLLPGQDRSVGDPELVAAANALAE